MTHIFDTFRKPARIGLAIGLALAFIGITSAMTARTSAHERLDCDSNAVIRCGIDHHNGENDIAELKRKYRENQQGNVQAVFAAFGMNNEAAFDGMVMGRVTGSNEVYVGNKLVATGATTAGRHRIDNERGTSGDMGGGHFWQRPPSVSFADPNGSLSALVKLDNNGVFKYAVILACGNPVGGQPVVQKPKEQPKKPNFEVVKDVRVVGQTKWQQEVQTKPGQKVEFRIVVRNTGETNLENVRVRDTLQSGMTYDENSLKVNGQKSGNLFTNTGLQLGTLNRGQHREITFTVTVNKNVKTSDNDKCARLRNVALAKHGDVNEKQDDAFVKVCREEVVTTTPPQVAPAVVTKEAPVAENKIIPETGVGSMLGLFSAVTLSGGAAHYVVTRRFNK